MPKKPSLDDIEIEEFRTAMKGVKPLVLEKKISAEPPKPRSIKKQSRDATEQEEQTALSDHEYLPSVTSDTMVAFKRTGIQHKVLRNLRAGQYNVEAILDMHGMTVAEANDSLTHFLSQCQQQGVCHVLIVHGKGRAHSHPILKNKLNHWLRDLPQVLAFSSAAAKDGRSGAMYVLLKNKKGEKLRDR